MLISNSKNLTNDKHSWLQEAKNEIYERSRKQHEVSLSSSGLSVYTMQLTLPG